MAAEDCCQGTTAVEVVVIRDEERTQTCGGDGVGGFDQWVAEGADEGQCIGAKDVGE